MCSCVIVCHPSPLQSAYHLAKPVRSFRAAPDTWTPTGQGEVCVCWGRRQERDCCELCSSCVPYTRIFSSLLLSHTIISAPSISPPLYCGGQGGEERGQMGWNEVHLHYLLPPLPFHSSPPIPLLLFHLPFHSLLSSPLPPAQTSLFSSLGLARAVWWWRG